MSKLAFQFWNAGRSAGAAQNARFHRAFFGGGRQSHGSVPSHPALELQDGCKRLGRDSKVPLSAHFSADNEGLSNNGKPFSFARVRKTDWVKEGAAFSAGGTASPRP